MKHIVTVFLILATQWAGVAFSVVQTVVEVGGTVEHWFADEQVVVVAGKRYLLADEAVIVDGNGKVLDVSVLRSGVPVLLIESEGEVGSITTINPRARPSDNRQAR